MGAFVGSFVYALAVLFQVRAGTPAHPEMVPALSTTVALTLALADVTMFVGYIHHMAHSIRAISVVSRIAQETRQSIECMYPTKAEEPLNGVSPPAEPPDQLLLHDRPAGVIVSVDESRLYRLACDRDVTIGLVPCVGDFVPRAAPLFKLWGAVAVGLHELRDCVAVGAERTPFQDPAFGFRQLVDVGERALSPGVNDPTTAVQALDQLHDLLRSLVGRPFPSGVRVDKSGRIRLVLPRPDWDSYVHLGLDEIRQYGCRSVQVMRRLRAIVLDLISIAPQERCRVLREQLEQLEREIAAAFDGERERDEARSPSAKGNN